MEQVRALGTQQCRDRTWHGHLTAAMLGLASCLGLASLAVQAQPASTQESGWKAAVGGQLGNEQSWGCGAVGFAHPASPRAGCKQSTVCQPCQRVGCDGHAATSPALRWGIEQRGSDGSAAGSLIRHRQQPWGTSLRASSSNGNVSCAPALALERWRTGAFWGRESSCLHLHFKFNWNKLRKLEVRGEWGGGRDRM